MFPETSLFSKGITVMKKARYLWQLLCVVGWLCVFVVPAVQAAPFLGDGKEYITYVNGTLWVFSMEDNTDITVRQISNNSVLWQTTIAKAGTMQSRAISANHIQIVATKRITVAVGSVGGSDAYGAYLVSENGTRIGKQFEGFTRSEVFVFCYLNGNSTLQSNIVITDVTDSGKTNDDTVTLTENNTVYKDANVQIWHRDNFDDDQIRVVANRDCSVMVGHRIRTNPADDWAVHVPSSLPGDGGRALGKQFYLFVRRTMMVIPTVDNTKVTIRDLSDGNDNRTLTLNRNQFFSARPYAKTYNGFQQINPSPANEFDDDFVEIIADKPVVVYVGPTNSDVNEYATHPSPIPMGNGKQRFFCYVQNGGASDFQIMASDNKTKVTITTMAGANNDTSILTTIGPGGLNWSGPAAGPNWWESAQFVTEFIQIDSDKPVMVLCGDFDQNSWLSFLPFEVPNRPPTLSVSGGTNQTVKEDQTLTFTITGSDPDNDTPLVWGFSGNPTGSILSGTGDVRTFTWKPTFSQAGTYTLTVTLKDPGTPPLTTTATITIKVEDVNRPPAFTSTPPSTATEDQVYPYTAKAVDPDGQTVTYALIKGPSSAGVNPPTGVLTWTPGDADVTAGTVDMTIRACDTGTPPLCVEQSWKVTVNNVNDAPKFTSNAPTQATEGQVYSYQPTFSDPDPGDTHTWKLVSGPSGLQVDPQTGKVTWTPTAADAAAGSRSVSIQVCDKQNVCVTQTWSISVTGINDPPKITSNPPLNASVGKLYAYNPTATDPDVGDTLTWKIKSAPSGVTINPTNGQLRWTPTTADTGNKSISIEVCDQKSACVAQTWTVAVTTNRPPVISGTPAANAFVGETYTYSPSVTDPDTGDTHTWALKSNPPGMTIDSTTGKVSWTPTATDVNKSYTITVEVCDNGTPASCVTQTFTILVRQKCGVDQNCAATLICVQGLCVDAGCYNKACASGELCVQGACVQNTCLVKLCGPGGICRPVDGQCVPVCPASCPTGQHCVNGSCVGDPCHNFQCPTGQRCDAGSCVADPCATAGSNACRYNRLCQKGACQDDNCSGVSCPGGGSCQLGQCYAVLPQEPTTESVAEVPTSDAGEVSLPESVDESLSESVTDTGNPTDTVDPETGTDLLPDGSVSPDDTESTSSDASETGTGDAGESITSDASESSSPDAGEVGTPDVSEPGTEDPGETVTSDSSETIGQDVDESAQSEGSTQDTASQDDVEKDGGSSQSDQQGDGGVVGGGCQCQAQYTGSLPMIVLLTLLILGLFQMRRSARRQQHTH